MSDEVIDQPAAAAAPQHTIEDVIARYVALRDKKAEYKAQYDAKVEAIDLAMTKVENYLLKLMQELGVESIRTAV